MAAAMPSPGGGSGAAFSFAGLTRALAAVDPATSSAVLTGVGQLQRRLEATEDLHAAVEVRGSRRTVAK